MTVAVAAEQRPGQRQRRELRVAGQPCTPLIVPAADLGGAGQEAIRVAGDRVVDVQFDRPPGDRASLIACSAEPQQHAGRGGGVGDEILVPQEHRPVAVPAADRLGGQVEAGPVGGAGPGRHDIGIVLLAAPGLRHRSRVADQVQVARRHAVQVCKQGRLTHDLGGIDDHPGTCLFRDGVVDLGHQRGVGADLRAAQPAAQHPPGVPGPDAGSLPSGDDSRVLVHAHPGRPADRQDRGPHRAVGQLRSAAAPVVRSCPGRVRPEEVQFAHVKEAGYLTEDIADDGAAAAAPAGNAQDRERCGHRGTPGVNSWPPCAPGRRTAGWPRPPSAAQ